MKRLLGVPARVLQPMRQLPVLYIVGTADPLNLAGIITPGERVRSIAANRIAYRDGIPLSVMEGDYLRPLAEVDFEGAVEVATALAGRHVPVVKGFVGRRAALPSWRCWMACARTCKGSPRAARKP